MLFLLNSVNTCIHAIVIYSEVKEMYTVESPNKGHVGDNVNSAVVSFVERLSSSRSFKMY